MINTTWHGLGSFAIVKSEKYDGEKSPCGRRVYRMSARALLSTILDVGGDGDAGDDEMWGSVADRLHRYLNDVKTYVDIGYLNVYF